MFLPRIPDYRPSYHYDHFNIAINYTILYGVSSYEPFARILPHLPNATLP